MRVPSRKVRFTMVLPVSIRWKVELASVRKYSRRLHPTHGAIGLAIPHREMKKNTRSVGVTRARRAGERVQCECREEHERERGEKENEDIEREDACWGNIGESLSPCMRHAHLRFIRCQCQRFLGIRMSMSGSRYRRGGQEGRGEQGTISGVAEVPWAIILVAAISIVDGGVHGGPGAEPLLPSAFASTRLHAPSPRQASTEDRHAQHHSLWALQLRGGGKDDGSTAERRKKGKKDPKKKRR